MEKNIQPNKKEKVIKALLKIFKVVLFTVLFYAVTCLYINRDFFYGRKVIYITDLKEKPDLSQENKKLIMIRYEPFRLSEYTVTDISLCDFLCKKWDDTDEIVKCFNEELSKRAKCESDSANCIARYMAEKSKEILKECKQIKEECKQYNCDKEIEALKVKINECKEDCAKKVDEYNNLPKTCRSYIATISLDSFGEEHEKRVDEARKECLKDRIKLIWPD